MPEAVPVFSLIITVKRGSACGLPESWARYPTIEAARTSAAAVARHERVQRVMVVRNTIPPVFVEWAAA